MKKFLLFVLVLFGALVLVGCKEKHQLMMIMVAKITSKNLTNIYRTME